MVTNQPCDSLLLMLGGCSGAMIVIITCWMTESAQEAGKCSSFSILTLYMIIVSLTPSLIDLMVHFSFYLIRCRR